MDFCGVSCRAAGRWPGALACSSGCAVAPCRHSVIANSSPSPVGTVYHFPKDMVPRLLADAREPMSHSSGAGVSRIPWPAEWPSSDQDLVGYGQQIDPSTSDMALPVARQTSCAVVSRTVTVNRGQRVQDDCSLRAGASPAHSCCIHRPAPVNCFWKSGPSRHGPTLARLPRRGRTCWTEARRNW